MLASASTPSEVGRVELFFKNPEELESRVDFLRSHGISSCNLVNKDKRDDMPGWVDAIKTTYPEADVCAHYSLKYNKVPRKGIEEQKELLLGFLETSSANEILLISGSGKKKTWNTVEALKVIRDATTIKGVVASSSHPRIAVAYNPYFPSPSDQKEENRRLVEKLSTGLVSKIYLQFCTDIERLFEGLEFLRAHTKNGSVPIAGSLFLPTKQLIAQQKFRPWNGVFLSPEFLEAPDPARGILLQMIRAYRTNHVEILWEAPGIRTEKDMGVVQELLSTAAATTDTDGIDSDDRRRLIKTTTAETTPIGEKDTSIAKRPKRTR